MKQMARFGKTLALESDGDLEVTELNSLRWIRGHEAVVQDLKVTLATTQGEDPFDRDHGLDTFATTGAGVGRLELEIVQALDRDDRVKKVDDVSIDREQNTRQASVSITVTLADDTSHTFTVEP